MAGAGYKLFNTGDVLTAAQVNTYLQEQTVMVFADSAARTTALSGVLAEGMMSYLQDTNAVEVYNGSAWVGVSGAGDVTEVQAGTGISVASGTGPIPVVTNTMATEITAKGDLIVGTGSGTFDNLPVGTNGYTLVADSVEATGLKWAAPAGGGKVLQVVYGSTTASTTIATTTFTDTGITATITPSAATSKVLVLTMCALYVDRQTTTADADARIMRDATQLLSTGTDGRFYLTIVDTATRVRFNTYSPLNYLDSPSTTSAVTYKVQGRISTTTNTGTSTWQLSSCPSNIILMEIGA